MGRIRLSPFVPFVCLILLIQLWQSAGQLTKPIAHDDNMKETAKKNKFMQREATDDSNPSPQLDEEALANTQCPQNVELRWQTEVGSSIYATPVINDINGDGKLEVIVPTFVHYLEVLEGSDGEKLAGWPVQHQSTVHASALVYDIDRDGNKEIVLATFEGEVLFYRAGGYKLPDKLIVPRLKMRRDWYVGLNPDPVDRSNPDVQDEIREEKFSDSGVTNSTEIEKSDKAEPDDGHNTTVIGVTNGTKTSPLVTENAENATINASESKAIDGASSSNGTEETTIESTVHQDSNIASGLDSILSNSREQRSQEGNHQRQLLQAEDRDNTAAESDAASGEDSKKSNGEDTPTVEDPDDAMEADARSSFSIFREEDENGEDGLTEEYPYDYDDYVNEDMWGDEDWDVEPHKKLEDMIEVDSHILATPVIADIDNDGIDEMIVAASYFYDREYYQSSQHAAELGDNIDISKYVAGAIVVFNLETKQQKWLVQLDHSTDTTNYRAYIYSAPTVVDLDGDGHLDIIVGNSVGFFYALDHTGKTKKNFPLQMGGEIQGQVVAADINDDGNLEIVTADAKGTVAAWTGQGTLLWDVHLKSLISQGPTVGDVDGDGHTDIVVPTTSGNIYVLKGSDGSGVGPYPFRTHGRVMSPALLVDLSKPGHERAGLTIAVGSFDGYFYLIDGPTGCADAIDIGETSYSMAVADNVDGGDDLDIIVTTMNGNVFCFQTPVPHHPLKAWPMQAQGRNNFASRYQREGIFVSPSSRRYRDEAGDNFHVTYEIVDKSLRQIGHLGPYSVTVSLFTPGNYRGEKRFTSKQTYDQPGVYTVTLPCLSMRTTGTVLVEMVDKNSLYFFDEFSITFHMHFYRLLKWLLTLPLLGMTGVMFVFRPRDEGAPLPSFSRDRQL